MHLIQSASLNVLYFCAFWLILAYNCSYCADKYTFRCTKHKFCTWTPPCFHIYQLIFFMFSYSSECSTATEICTRGYNTIQPVQWALVLSGSSSSYVLIMMILDVQGVFGCVNQLGACIWCYNPVKLIGYM